MELSGILSGHSIILIDFNFQLIALIPKSCFASVFVLSDREAEHDSCVMSPRSCA